jgi:thiol:disulfide interchange protein DsbD
MALYFLMPLLGGATPYIFLIYFIGAGLYLMLWEARQAHSKQFRWVMVALGGIAIAVGLWWVRPEKIGPGIPWQPYSEGLLQQARQEGKGVIIDVFADWCVPCHELDKLTFNDAEVRKEAEKFIMVKVDLTKKDQPPHVRSLLANYNVKGVPMVLFFDPSGRERSDIRLKGFEKPEKFLELMRTAERKRET